MTDPYRALADPTRRELLDRLRLRDGQTLSELVDGLGMTRQTVTQHLGVLEGANLVAVIRRGRERLHYLNPVPLHEIRSRWLSAFDEVRLDELDAIRKAATVPRPDFVYVTYITASAERVWDALTSAELTAEFWGHSNVSTWTPGDEWQHVRIDGSGIADVTGTVVSVDRPHSLAMTFGGDSVVTFTIEAGEGIVKLTIVHSGIETDGDAEAAAIGWASVASNLKSLLETGSVMPQAPWEMHAGLRAQRMSENDPR